MLNTDRDPIDPTTIANAVSQWLTTDPHDGAGDDALLHVLVDQGVLHPLEASQADICECEDDPRADVFIQGGALCVSVCEDGTVFVTDCR